MIGRDGIAALVVLAACAALFAATIGLKPSPFVPIGPGFYPRLVLGVTAALALAVLAGDLARHRRRAEPQRARPSGRGRVLLLFIAFGLYAVAMPAVGFRMATFAFMVLAQVVLDPPQTARRWVVIVAIAGATTAATWLVFERQLSVLLPRGRWTGF